MFPDDRLLLHDYFLKFFEKMVSPSKPLNVRLLLPRFPNASVECRMAQDLPRVAQKADPTWHVLGGSSQDGLKWLTTIVSKSPK